MDDGTPMDVEPGAADFALEYYMFDWDDNILHMPTKIYLEKRTDDAWVDYPVSTADFALIRRDTINYRPINGDWDEAFAEFYDSGKRGEKAFLEDTVAALQPLISGEQKGGPSLQRFRQALMEGRLFAIITARAHAPGNIRQGVEYFLENVLSGEERRQMVENLRGFSDLFEEDHHLHSGKEVIEKYLGLNKYHGVTSPQFQSMVGVTLQGAESPAHAKKLAIRDFVEHVIEQVRDKGVDAPIRFGFSDDDKHNILTVEDFLERELVREFPDIRFVIYDTSDPSIPGGKKIVVQGQLDLGLDHLPDTSS